MVGIFEISQFTEIEDAAVSKSAARFNVWPLVLKIFVNSLGTLRVRSCRKKVVRRLGAPNKDAHIEHSNEKDISQLGFVLFAHIRKQRCGPGRRHLANPGAYAHCPPGTRYRCLERQDLRDWRL